MSAATASSTELVTLFVRLLDEGTDVWRPVEAHRVSAVIYRITDTPPPVDERWSFHPGDTVVAETRDSGGGAILVAVARASAFDARSLAALAV